MAYSQHPNDTFLGLFNRKDKTTRLDPTQQPKKSKLCSTISKQLKLIKKNLTIKHKTQTNFAQKNSTEQAQ